MTSSKTFVWKSLVLGSIFTLVPSSSKHLLTPSQSWIHFEGRTKSGERPHVNEIMKYLIEKRKKHGYAYRLSIELEKTYEGLKDLAILADVVFVSKEFAGYMGSKSPEG